MHSPVNHLGCVRQLNVIESPKRDTIHFLTLAIRGKCQSLIDVGNQPPWAVFHSNGPPEIITVGYPIYLLN